MSARRGTSCSDDSYEDLRMWIFIILREEVSKDLETNFSPWWEKSWLTFA